MYEQLFSWFLIALGLVLLVFGGEILVRGASAIAQLMRISPLVVGLTVVAFGTSAPELGVSLQASLSGAADVAVGNIVGSSIFNVLFILGIASLVTPLVVDRQLVRFDVPIMIGLSVLTWFLVRDGNVNHLDGLALFLILLSYLYVSFRKASRESKDQKLAETEPAATAAESETDLSGSQSSKIQLLGHFGLIVGGLICLGFGSRWLVSGAISIATFWGVSELVIGLTIVAIGTSLPEVVTSVVASIRGQRDIAIGNVVGSNIFNLACVLGVTGLVAPNGIPVSEHAIQIDFPVMVLVALACWPVFAFGKTMSRWEGMLFLIALAIYNAILVK